jgi:hypothetical protein
MTTCPHTELASEARIVKFDDTQQFMAEFTVRCALCGIPFRFLGPPTGLSMTHPTVDVPATTLHAPIAPGERAIADVPGRLSFMLND